MPALLERMQDLYAAVRFNTAECMERNKKGFTLFSSDFFLVFFVFVFVFVSCSSKIKCKCKQQLASIEAVGNASQDSACCPHFIAGINDGRGLVDTPWVLVLCVLCGIKWKFN